MAPGVNRRGCKKDLHGRNQTIAGGRKKRGGKEKWGLEPSSQVNGNAGHIHKKGGVGTSGSKRANIVRLA